MATTCKGQAYDPNPGMSKPCPLRGECRRYTRMLKGRKDKTPLNGPYDFDSNECSYYLAD